MIISTSVQPDDTSKRAFSVRSKNANYAILVLVTVIIILAARALFAGGPRSFAQIGSLPIGAIRRAGIWYWMENPQGPHAQLVRADENGKITRREADVITGFDVAGDTLVYIARKGNSWSGLIARTDGREEVVWSGPNEAWGPKGQGNTAYWSVQIPPSVSDKSSLPPLAPGLQILSGPIGSAKSAVVAKLLEREGSIIGIHSGKIYLAAYRSGSPGSTAFYTVPLTGGTPQRIAGEAGRSLGIVTRDGTLMWIGQSRESSDEVTVSCIRRIGSDGKAETVMDWLPRNGELFDTDHGVYYVDGGAQPSLWPLGTADRLPRPASVSKGFAPVALGEGEILLRPDNLVLAPVSLFKAPLP